MDFSILRKDGTHSISRKALRDRIQRTVETIAFENGKTDYKLDLEKFLRDNVDILTGVVAYAEKDPSFKMNLDKVMKEHTEVFATAATGDYKRGKFSGKSMDKNLKDKNFVTVAAAIGTQEGLRDFTPGVASTCFADDRFVTRDKLEPLTAYAVPPQPVEPPVPSNNRCRKMISF